MKISLGMELSLTLESIDAAAENFLKHADGRKIFAFYGELGAGKTTFINALCKVLQVRSNVSSPTFAIINEYLTENNKQIFHIDLYRLQNESEAINAGVEDCIISGNICFIEWPENAPGLLPAETVHCYIDRISQNERKLQINL